MRTQQLDLSSTGSVGLSCRNECCKTRSCCERVPVPNFKSCFVGKRPVRKGSANFKLVVAPSNFRTCLAQPGMVLPLIPGCRARGPFLLSARLLTAIPVRQ